MSSIPRQATPPAGFSFEKAETALSAILAQHEKELRTFIESQWAQWAQWHGGSDARLPGLPASAISHATREHEGDRPPQKGVDSGKSPREDARGVGQEGHLSLTDFPKQPQADSKAALEEMSSDAIEKHGSIAAAQTMTCREDGPDRPAVDEVYRPRPTPALGFNSTDLPDFAAQPADMEERGSIAAAQTTAGREDGPDRPAAVEYRPRPSPALGLDGTVLPDLAAQPEDSHGPSRGPTLSAIDRVRIQHEGHMVGIDSTPVLSASKSFSIEQPFWIRVVHSNLYEGAVVFLILANALCIGAETNDYALRSKEGDTEPPAVFLWAHLIFLVVFTVELIIRAAAYQKQFCSHKERGWNAFDCVVVLLMWVDTVFIVVVEAGETVASLRILHSMRIVRALRIIRLFSFFKELRVMLSTVLMSMSSLFWVIILMLLLFYVFGITITAGVVDYLTEEQAWTDAETQDMRRHFGRVDSSILSLFQGMSGGISWYELYNTLGPLHWTYIVEFLLFIVFSLLAIANLITGIFVTSALQRAHDEKESLIEDALTEKEEYLEKIHLIFKEIDADHSDHLSFAEMEAAIGDERMAAYFGALGITAEDVGLLFFLLDPDGNGRVDPREFLAGCLKLKGGAKGIDLALLQYQVKWLMQKTQAMSETVVGALRSASLNSNVLSI